MSSSHERFRTWARSKSISGTYYIRNHRFEKTSEGTITVDKGSFELEEAEEIGEMLLSQNPVAQLNAQVAIWEKNGGLLKMVLVGAIILLILVVLIVRR
ncbi:MAG: hypothetical protein ACRECH_00060 [Nitrososphaerales archaeon]